MSTSCSFSAPAEASRNLKAKFAPKHESILFQRVTDAMQSRLLKAVRKSDAVVQHAPSRGALTPQSKPHLAAGQLCGCLATPAGAPGACVNQRLRAVSPHAAATPCTRWRARPRRPAATEFTGTISKACRARGRPAPKARLEERLAHLGRDVGLVPARCVKPRAIPCSPRRFLRNPPLNPPDQEEVAGRRRPLAKAVRGGRPRQGRGARAAQTLGQIRSPLRPRLPVY